jgi:flavin-dependent dehydrogenase
MSVPEFDAEVIVAGAGPAGSLATHTPAEAGLAR